MRTEIKNIRLAYDTDNNGWFSIHDESDDMINLHNQQGVDGPADETLESAIAATCKYFGCTRDDIEIL